MEIEQHREPAAARRHLQQRASAPAVGIAQRGAGIAVMLEGPALLRRACQTQ
jgi:hypothetical protein